MLLMPYLEYNNWCSCCQSLLMIDATRFQTQSNNSWLSRPRLRSSFLRLRNHDHSRLWISSSTGSAVVVRNCRYRISPWFLYSKLDIYVAIAISWSYICFQNLKYFTGHWAEWQFGINSIFPPPAQWVILFLQSVAETGCELRWVYLPSITLH